MNLKQENRDREMVKRARDIFMKYGIRSVSMDDISRDLAISKKTLYQHFENKHALLSHVLDYSFEEFDKTIQEILSKNLNAIDDLIELSIKINTHIQTSHPSVNFDLQKYYPELFRENQQKIRSYTAHYIKENIIKGISEGVYRKKLKVDLISSLYIQKLEDVHDTDYHGPAVSFETIFEVMFENHIRGIANEQGIAYFEKKKKAIKF